MPESGEWFSPRTRPEMLTSDDPPIAADKPELIRILPGPATPVGRATAPLRQRRPTTTKGPPERALRASLSRLSASRGR